MCCSTDTHVQSHTGRSSPGCKNLYSCALVEKLDELLEHEQKYVTSPESVSVKPGKTMLVELRDAVSPVNSKHGRQNVTDLLATELD